MESMVQSQPLLLLLLLLPPPPLARELYRLIYARKEERVSPLPRPFVGLDWGLKSPRRARGGGDTAKKPRDTRTAAAMCGRVRLRDAGTSVRSLVMEGAGAQGEGGGRRAARPAPQCAQHGPVAGGAPAAADILRSTPLSASTDAPD
ncbi:hypothetical protein JKP88DRAFT_284813 [Tribonema minus]|uniref:Secreted protein n=1 Tax=Tribonema minus TaxID=303371 RepID=A0A836CNE4_9STRA|nr:hypothetical protein JKP88DRAFT_284813 [Tribonema minus]